MRSTKLVGFQAAPELKEKLQKAADAKHLRVSDILRLAVYEYLEKEGM